jgi:tetratricopeptide (TPR) repeat protein
VGLSTLASQLLFTRVGIIASQPDSAEKVDPTMVDELLGKAASLDPSDYHVRQVHLFQVLYPLAQQEEPYGPAAHKARKRLKELLEINPTSSALLEMKKKLRSLRYLSGTRPGDLSNPEEALLRASELINEGQIHEAKRLIDRVLQSNEGNADALHTMYLALREEGDEAGAQEYMRLSQLAFAFEFTMQRKHEQALVNLKLSRRYGDGNGEAWMLEALSLYQQNLKEQAEQVLKEAPVLNLSSAPSWLRDAVQPLVRDGRFRPHLQK